MVREVPVSPADCGQSVHDYVWVWWPGQRNVVAMSLEKNYNSAKPAASMFNQNGNTQSPLFGTLSRGFNVSYYKHLLWNNNIFKNI